MSILYRSWKSKARAIYRVNSSARLPRWSRKPPCEIEMPRISSTEHIYFGLLWEHELAQLKPLLKAIAAHRDAVLARWWELYCLHFDDNRGLSQAEFVNVHGPDLDATVKTLARGDFTGFVAALREVGQKLIERNVPFAEVIASMHLFEEAAIEVFPSSADSAEYRLFDKVSHCRTVVLAEAYFAAYRGMSAARIDGLEREAEQLSETARARFHGIVGGSPAMHALYERIKAVAGVNSTVLIVGESGTGKELVARAIHECSPRRHGPFVALNCAALPRELIESELFGYRRGAFSGAVSDQLGLFRAAEKGSLFLDEITEMSPDTQSKLLRVLQEKAVRPIGSTREVPVDVRVLASTNRNPEQALKAKRLRPDLYYRLNVNTIEVPPLREHLEDVPLLVEHFIALFNAKLQPPRPIVGVDPSALQAMCSYTWPGNVRELSNAIEQAFTFCRSDIITLDDLPPMLVGSTAVGRPRAEEPRDGAVDLSEYQRRLVERVLALCDGNKLKAARMLGISRKTLYAKIRKYGLDRNTNKTHLPRPVD